METNIITTEQEIERPFVCEICNKRFLSKANLATHQKIHDESYVSHSVKKYNKRLEEYNKSPEHCKNCNSPIPYSKIKTKKADRKKANRVRALKCESPKEYNFFCNSSCAATYNNTHKTHGNRKSKLEFYVEDKLIEMYPTIDFHFNKKSAIESELDIYIPILKLAFELNGIFHYKPIYGTDKLAKIQSNDNKKARACLEKGIDLRIIDASKLTYFKDSNVEPYFNTIKDIIDQKVEAIQLDLSKLPTANVERGIRTSKHKQCKMCNKEFIYKTTPRQVFCSKECSVKYKQNKGLTYSEMIVHKETIRHGVLSKLSLNMIAKSIGFEVCAGGYFYTLKHIIEEIKKEI